MILKAEEDKRHRKKLITIEVDEEAFADIDFDPIDMGVIGSEAKHASDVYSPLPSNLGYNPRLAEKY